MTKRPIRVLENASETQTDVKAKIARFATAGWVGSATCLPRRPGRVLTDPDASAKSLRGSAMRGLGFGAVDRRAIRGGLEDQRCKSDENSQDPKQHGQNGVGLGHERGHENANPFANPTARSQGASFCT